MLILLLYYHLSKCNRFFRRLFDFFFTWVKTTQTNPDKNQKKKLPPHTKKHLDQLVIEAVIRDARCFTDFDKPGLKKFLQLALPGNERARIVSESLCQSAQYFLIPTHL